MNEENSQRHFDLKEEREKRQRKRSKYILTKTNYKSVVEELIQEAQERGDFDDLAGHGEPLDLEQNTFAGDMQLAYKMLKDNNFTLPWIEDRNRLLEEIKELREKIQYQWQLFGPQVLAMARGGQDAIAERRWTALLMQWTTLIGDINRRIKDVNFSIPVRDLDVMTLGLEIELARLGADEDIGVMLENEDKAEK